MPETLVIRIMDEKTAVLWQGVGEMSYSRNELHEILADVLHKPQDYQVTYSNFVHGSPYNTDGKMVEIKPLPTALYEFQQKVLAVADYILVQSRAFYGQEGALQHCTSFEEYNEQYRAFEITCKQLESEFGGESGLFDNLRVGSLVQKVLSERPEVALVCDSQLGLFVGIHPQDVFPRQGRDQFAQCEFLDGISPSQSLQHPTKQTQNTELKESDLSPGTPTPDPDQKGMDRSPNPKAPSR